MKKMCDLDVCACRYTRTYSSQLTFETVKVRDSEFLYFCCTDDSNIYIVGLNFKLLLCTSLFG
jgi:hypothetical protein